ncbi:FecR domain-containing protein [Niveispirillum sp. BGYR6]|uniref:FecR family protein n=1 Tax=Niveispirillum sp. BGYR6 TaxID=2971249 RepID=UPI0022B967CC|nr:FecR domain-containing protein [Niveispirillum sp. BGYR6]MDG5497464.1 DUF4880 domain-containing protein [Niveispirillum sp. BGYR6]
MNRFDLEIDADPALEEAADWLLGEGEWTPERQARFLAWLSANPAHAPAMEQVRATWHDPVLEQLLRQAAAERVVPFPSRPLAKAQPANNITGLDRRRLLAAGLAGLAVMGAGGLWLRGTPAQAYDLSSPHGQRRDAILPDGSRLVLDAASRVTGRFGNRQRLLTLLEGQMALAVTAAEQPFRAGAGGLELEMPDGAFTLDQAAGRLDLSVTTGRLQARLAGRTYDLTAGERLLTAGDRAERGRLTDAPSFQQGWLVVHEQRLDMVLARLARYTPTGLRLARAELAALPVSGRFALDRPADSLRLLARLHKLPLAETADGMVLG